MNKTMLKQEKTFDLPLNDSELKEFGMELDAIQREVMASRGEKDARYIRTLIQVQRSMAIIGRIFIYLSLFFLPQWDHAYASYMYFFPIIGLGVLILGIAKILENMEIGHNVLHGQWDWMKDPSIQSGTWEWDHACPSDNWKYSHNVRHHTWTNVFGKDADVAGYGLLRIFPEQKWSKFNLGNPIYAFFLAVFFEWGVAIQELELGLLLRGKKNMDKMKPIIDRTIEKSLRQGLKDYILFPLLAGPFFLYVMAANALACILRNLWTFMIIFCGHFSEGVHTFSRRQVENETRPQWYLRQLLGSCNIKGGKYFHILSGNLSHQIEHHLFPDMPSNRYPEIAPRIQALCDRYNLPYNTGRLTRQFGTTLGRIFRMALP